METKNTCNFFWNDLPTNSFSVFQDMRKSGQFCDVTINVGKHSFSAHRIVLAAAVPYFRAMFRFGMSEEEKEEIHLKEIDPLALESLIDFVYTNTLNITGSNVQSLLATALYLQLDTATDTCFKFLLKRFSPDNVITARAFADSINKLHFVEVADLYIRENFDQVAATEEFLSLPFTYMKGLISRDDLNVTGEEIVFDAVVKWVKVEDHRHAFLPDLLQRIRFPLLTLNYIAKHVATEDLIYKSPPCVNMLNEVIHYHLFPTREGSAHCSFATRERYCKRKHHLKCAKIMGCGMYTISKTADKKISLSYYDPIHDRWAPIFENYKSVPFGYLICTEDKICFFHKTHIQVFNLQKLERSSLAYPDEFNVSEPGISLHGGKIYLMGGEGASSDVVHCFNPYQKTCAKEGKMAAHRMSPNTASLGECIYVIGGFYEDRVLSSAERYNTWTGRSTEISSLLIKACDYGCSVLNNKIYVCGGVTVDGRPSNITQQYDPETDRWTFAALMNTPMESLSLVPYAEKLLAVEDTRTLNDVQIFDPCHNEWKSVKPIFCSRRVEELIVVVTNTTWKVKYF